MAATEQQVQRFCDERLRPRAEQVRSLLLAIESDLDSIDDVYEAMEAPEGKGWKDSRTDGPPCLMTPDMILGVNAFLHDLQIAIRKHEQWPVVAKLCVRPVSA